MTKPKYATVVTLDAAEKQVIKSLAFTVACKNTGKLKTYDFSKKKYSKTSREILEIYVWAVYKIRHSQNNTTRTMIYDRANRFFDFLEIHNIYDPNDLSTAVLSQFAEWLKRYSSISYASAGTTYRSFSSVFNQMSRHPKIKKDFKPIRNAFPKSSSLQTATTGYDKAELKQIIKAAVQELREQQRIYEARHEPQFLGMPAPLEGVAPINPNTGKRSIWCSHEHHTWYFENVLGCQRLIYSEAIKYPKGHTWAASICYEQKTPFRSLADFYDHIGAGPEYQPIYLGLPSPIQHRTPWTKKDYVLWYWENKMDATSYSWDVLRSKFPEFLTAMREHWGSPGAFFKEVYADHWISGMDLGPYYLMLLIRTGMNPAVIQRLTVDCIKADPLDYNRKSIDWTKYRSSKKDKTIPANTENDTWAVAIVERIIKITEPIRKKGQKELWISNAGPDRGVKPFGKEVFQRAIRRISEKYQIRKTDTNEVIEIKARLIRPTIAWHEYLRTEDLRYLQTLLSHVKLQTTAEYLRRLDDPVFRSRRGIHQHAMLLGLTYGEEQKKSFLDEEESQLIAKDALNGIYDGMINHCKNPKDSPVPGEKKGEFCKADVEVCQGCQNLVITPEDIKKFFCFIDFYSYLFDVGDINEEEFNGATKEKEFFWSEYILPEYPKSVVEKLKTEAKLDPIPVWDIHLYEESRR